MAKLTLCRAQAAQLLIVEHYREKQLLLCIATLTNPLVGQIAKVNESIALDSLTNVTHHCDRPFGFVESRLLNVFNRNRELIEFIRAQSLHGVIKVPVPEPLESR